tara:strand:+ start:45 stop:392 length:348 start_codon:yes stop_codon:yes gene_type:complete
MESYAMKEINRSLRLTASLIRLVMFNIAVIGGQKTDNPVFDLCTRMLKELKPVYKRIAQFEAETDKHDWIYIRREQRNLSKMRTTLRSVCRIYGTDYKAVDTQYLANAMFRDYRD